ncbi:hypothetical protein FMM80_06500 [Schaedlerella arabinosiphila]|uniref:Uncharacterized protein n=1 Tax=Schaedlerella arabinosiphila TaxID=2044587 RepID=A0A9X5C5G2_9FIRM|nr:hypothetical protein [Schaedlerella arabinosiphila]KAI4443728.1 hypothetical protein C824_006264 [Schaedlerella arabinosiphila]NDO68355.1 hypothetical protein [Schaedlerella arabinosiphila]
MYPVSEAFLRAVQENTRRYYWTGRITTKGGAVYLFGYEDIVKGSGYIFAQCCGSAEIELGTVYAAEMGVTLFSQVDRYTLDGAKVELFYHLRVEGGGFEEVPMGIFEVSEANRRLHCLELKAYDYMLRFEKSFNGFESVGNAWAFLELCCKACGVEIENTQGEIEGMPNGRELLSIYPENDIGTYRDVLFFVGQVLGGFFCINRRGRLELRKYGAEPVLEVQGRHRFSSSFSDFITRYTAVSSTNLRTQTAEYYGLEVDDGLTMNLGVNPLLQFGLEETRRQLCGNILADLAAVNYVPFDSSTIGNPALDLGDVLTFTGGQADGEQMTCITSFQCRIGGRQSLKCVGKNPRLAQAKSKNDKNISGLLNQIEAGKVGIHTFTNASAYVVAEDRVRVISIEFAAKEETHVQFFGQVVLDVRAAQVERRACASGSVVVPVPVAGAGGGTGGGVAVGAVSGDGEEAGSAGDDGGTGESTENVTVEVELPVIWTEDGQAAVFVTYELNDSEILAHRPVETWGSGRHILSLYYPIDGLVPNITNTFNVYLRMEGGTGKIETGGCIASISGQGMAAAAAWDGTVTVEEPMRRFALGGGLGMKVFAGDMGIETMELVQRSYGDSMGKVLIGAFGKPFEIG